MSLYEARLQADLESIRARVAGVGKNVDDAVQRAVRALLERDHPLAYQVALGDLPINRATREIDRMCHALVARHSPAAGHLRYVSSVLRLTVALERIGDYAVTVARESVQLSTPLPPNFAQDIELIASQSRRMLQGALEAFDTKNAELATRTMKMAAEVDATYEKVFDELVSTEEAPSTKDTFALLATFNKLERVSDQAKNICEETVFVVTGQTKKPKVYRILFVDETNSCHSILAEAIARRAFANSGRYQSAGWKPATGLYEPLEAFAEKKGIDLSESAPRSLNEVRANLADYHVIVSVKGDAISHLGKIPFHTILLEWNVDGVPPDDGGDIEVALEELRRTLSVHVRLLMETMRGEGAD